MVEQDLRDLWADVNRRIKKLVLEIPGFGRNAAETVLLQLSYNELGSAYRELCGEFLLGNATPSAEQVREIVDIGLVLEMDEIDGPYEDVWKLLMEYRGAVRNLARILHE